MVRWSAQANWKEAFADMIGVGDAGRVRLYATLFLDGETPEFPRAIEFAWFSLTSCG